MTTTSPYGFTDAPFHVTPDTRFLYLHKSVEEALATLSGVIAGGKGFAIVTGEVGAGKTTLLRAFLARLPIPAETAVLFQTDLRAEELLREVALELGIEIPQDAELTKQTLLERIRDRLLEVHAAGKTVVLLVDEAQNLSLPALESIRMLSNLETEQEKLIQILLFGQTELDDLLARPEARQIRSRIAARVHLGPLRAEETEVYLRHRIEIARPSLPVAISPEGAKALHDAAGGIPRLVNLIADRAIEIGAGAEGGPRPVLGPEEIAAAAADHPALARDRAARSGVALPWIAAVAAGLILVGGGVGYFLRGGASTSRRPPASASAPASAAQNPRAASAEIALPDESAVGKWLSDLGETEPHLGLLDAASAARAAGLVPVGITVSRDAVGRIPLSALLLPQSPFVFDRPVLLGAATDSGILLDLPSGQTSIPVDALPPTLQILYAAPAEVLPPYSLVPGDDFVEVERLEARLIALGRLSGRSDSYYGTKTAHAVRALQEEMGIRRDGIFGPETAIALHALERSGVVAAPTAEAGEAYLEPAAAPTPVDTPVRRGT